LQSRRTFEGEGLPIDDHKDLNESVVKKNETRNILAIGQDIISCNSGGRKKMQKNVGLTLAMKTMVQGKGNNHYVKPTWPLYKLLGM